MLEAQFSLKEISDLGRVLHMVIPASLISQEYQKNLKEIASQMDMPGFRKGKVPVKVAEHRFGTDLKKESAQQLINKLYQKYLSDHKLHALGWLGTERIQMDEPGSLGFDITFELEPPIKLDDLKTIKVKRYEVKVSDEDVAKQIEHLCQQSERWLPTEEGYKITKGERLTVEVKINDESINKDGISESKTANDFPQFLFLDHESDPLKEVWSKLFKGAKIGEEVSSRVKVPEKYYVSALPAGEHEVTFKIKEIATLRKATISDLVQYYNLESELQLREQIKKQLEDQAKLMSEALFDEEALTQIIAQRWEKDPNLTIDQRLSNQRQNWEKHLNEHHDAESNEDAKHTKKTNFPEDEVRSYIADALRRSIILHAFEQNHSVTVEQNDVREVFMEQLNQAAQVNPSGVNEFVAAVQHDRGYWNNLAKIAKNRKLIKLLAKELGIEAAPISLEELGKLEAERKEQALKRIERINDYVEW